LFVGISEGGKDFSGDAEVRVVHVLALFGLREAQGDAAEVGWSGWHGALLRRKGNDNSETLSFAENGHRFDTIFVVVSTE